MNESAAGGHRIDGASFKQRFLRRRQIVKGLVAANCAKHLNICRIWHDISCAVLTSDHLNGDGMNRKSGRANYTGSWSPTLIFAFCTNRERELGLEHRETG